MGPAAADSTELKKKQHFGQAGKYNYAPVFPPVRPCFRLCRIVHRHPHRDNTARVVLVNFFLWHRYAHKGIALSIYPVLGHRFGLANPPQNSTSRAPRLLATRASSPTPTLARVRLDLAKQSQIPSKLSASPGSLTTQFATLVEVIAGDFLLDCSETVIHP